MNSMTGPVPPARPARPPAGPGGRALRSVVALMLREMTTSYGRSPGGYAWAILEPVGGIAILTLAFSMVLHRPALGSNFALFYASGFLPFLFYTGLSTRIGQAIQFSRPLLSYPTVSFLDALLARFVLNSLTHAIVFVVVLGGIHIAFDLRAEPAMGALVTAFALTALLALGVGTLHCFLCSAFPLWDQLWNIANRPLFLVSGIFFLIDSLSPQWREILWWNPLIHIAGLMRRGLYP